MPVTLSTVLSPGTYVTENTTGVIPVERASFLTVYMMGTGTTGALNTPTQVLSEDDFKNIFGATSASAKHARLFFANAPTAVLKFVRITAVTAGAATATEWTTAINAAGTFTPEMSQGFLIAPEAAETLSAQGDRTTVYNALEAKAASEGYQWMVLADCGPYATINTAAQYNTEGQLYVTPKGHLAYFAPQLINDAGVTCAPSPAVAAVAVQRYKVEGFAQPPAGVRYPLKGITGPKVTLGRLEQDVANPLGINLIRTLPGQGTVVYGSRTRSTNAFYRFINTRVILNAINGTLRSAFDQLIFNVIDGRDILFTQIRQTAETILYDFWSGGALYGATPEQAFVVICDARNNSALDLEAGIVRVDIYVATSPTLERLLIGVIRVAIGQVGLQSGNTTN